ncbi:hypothetical protein SCHPADRAFT_943551 [Schizopora paradoxa]|uniref:Uncharacterized protein n=1 Tax=Schizopora paradoxa TaxID=27342 RepID=A0A0H2RJD7_9AGAM|nr:hypothetical protein SCHPADRAFT_943551 [Schizopora paradoxa]
MSSVVKIKSKPLSVEYIDVEGRILARVKGSNARFESPLTLYSNGAGIPLQIESNKILQKDSDVKWLDEEDSLQCNGCGEQLQTQELLPQDMLQKWIIHKLQCAALQLNIHGRKSREKPKSRRENYVGRKHEFQRKFSFNERIDFLRDLRDVKYVTPSKGIVFCKPCKRELKVGPGLNIANFVRHTSARVHIDNGGIPMDLLSLTPSERLPEVSSQCESSDDSGSPPLGQASSGNLRKRKKYIRNSRSVSPSNSEFESPGPNVEDAVWHLDVSEASGHQRVTAVLN